MDVIIATLKGFCTVFFKKENTGSFASDDAENLFFRRGSGFSRRQKGRQSSIFRSEV